MTRWQFLELAEELSPYINPDPRTPNHWALSGDKKLTATIYYLKYTGSLYMTTNTFGIAVNTVSSVIYEVCYAICKYLGSKHIHSPSDEDEIRQKVSEFETKYGMLQAFGCIDATHIPIKCPNENSQDYYCYKQFYSLNVLAVCDYRGMFMDVECKWPGSVHESKLFANSAINMSMRNGTLPTTFQTVIQGCEKIPNYLIGDPAYPLTPFCMKEYDHCKCNEQVIFNNLLRSARNPIECTFGRLKARWAILSRKMDLKLESIPVVIYVCFVLRNYCEKYKSYIDEDEVKS